jgi:hypothetical protein|tara:strand:+ start:5726 stop:6331 length:606 start_codon:yes stop_codon:yes gene_type:complete
MTCAMSCRLIFIGFLLMILVSACASAGPDEQPSQPRYTFDLAKAKKALVAGLDADLNGDAKAALDHFQKAIDIFPVYFEAFEAIAVTAGRIGDARNLRYARFFMVRMDSIAKLGPRNSARAFENLTRDDPANKVKEPKIRMTAARIVAFLDTVVCEKSRLKKKESEEKQSFVARYGFEGWLRYLDQWTAGPASECPAVIVR